MAHQMSKRAASAEIALAENTAAQRIVTAARHHFFAHGFRGVTMDDLAQELGMSKKTLYRCFPSKADVVKAVLLDKLDGVEAELAVIVSRSSRNFPTALHDVLACMQRHTEEIRPPFLRDLQRE